MWRSNKVEISTCKLTTEEMIAVLESEKTI